MCVVSEVSVKCSELVNDSLEVFSSINSELFVIWYSVSSLPLLIVEIDCDCCRSC